MATQRIVPGAGGVDLAVYERGPADGPTVVLVHGFPDCAAVWDGVADDLATDHHVVTYDVRGTGRSTTPEGGTVAYHLDLLSADLVAVLDTVSPDRPVHLVGHDWGSIQTWESVTDPALRHRIASYTSISGPCLDHVGHWLRRRLRTRSQLRQVASQAGRSSYVALLQLPGAPLIAAALFQRAWPALLRRAEGLDASTATLARDTRHGAELYRANMLRVLLRPRRRTTEVPVQAIVLEGDQFVPGWLTDGMDEFVADLRLRHEPGGHWSIASQPSRTAGWVRDHVAVTT